MSEHLFGEPLAPAHEVSARALPRATRAPWPVVAAAARGTAAGLLLVTVLVGAYAGLNLHLATPIGDALIGALLVLMPISLVWAALSAIGWMARTAADRIGRTRHHPPAVARVLAGGGRLAGNPLVASTASIAGMVLLAPENGLLAMYRNLAPFEVLIATGAVVGMLTGIGRWATGSAMQTPTKQVMGPTMLCAAVLLSGAVLAWAAFPGFGDAIVREDPATLAAVVRLDLPDPSKPGPYEVTEATYGSNAVGRRPEFGVEADWLTPTVDASEALADRDPVSGFFSTVLWGHDETQLPINGRAWYPAATEAPMPVALIVHGNHAAGEFSDPGYAYLGEHLASQGILAVSVDENYLNGDAFFDYGGAEQGVRAWMLLRHLGQLEEWNADPAHPLHGRVDLDRVALIGHSRGGEAASVAAMLEAGDGEVQGLPPVPRGFGIRAVVGIAPSDGQYRGPGMPVRLTDVDYLVLQGAHDGDLPAFTGLGTYHRVTYGGGGGHLKVALYSQRANHGRFNSVWDTGDAGSLASWLLDRASILSADEQQDLAKGVIGAFLQRSLFGETGYDAFFRDPRAGRAWLPDDVVLTHWTSSGRAVLDDFSIGLGDGTTATGFDEAVVRDPRLRDTTAQGDRALELSWSGPAQVSVTVPPRTLPAIDDGASLVLSLAAADDRPVAPTIDLELTDGRSFSLALADVSPLRPRLPTNLWKVEALGARYLPEEQLAWPAERFLQTYAIPLARFGPVNDVDWAVDLERVTVRFAGAGSGWLDDLAIEPG